LNLVRQCFINFRMRRTGNCFTSHFAVQCFSTSAYMFDTLFKKLDFNYIVVPVVNLKVCLLYIFVNKLKNHEILRTVSRIGDQSSVDWRRSTDHHFKNRCSKAREAFKCNSHQEQAQVHSNPNRRLLQRCNDKKPHTK